MRCESHHAIVKAGASHPVGTFGEPVEFDRLAINGDRYLRPLNFTSNVLLESPLSPRGCKGRREVRRRASGGVLQVHRRFPQVERLVLVRQGRLHTEPASILRGVTERELH
jgi:hypothetical protein